ncbi:MAG: TetR/AcrR family transcriptional regulator [Hespellia sp.]|nr:TetR/AcrR family transcriptional regulator [Hespellia sp.]
MDQSAYFEQMRKKRQQEILETAKQIFLAEGLEGFTMQKLAKMLDVSTVTLYKYYKNSEDILLALQSEIVALGIHITSCKNAEEEPLEYFLATMEKFLSESVKNREDLRLLFLSRVYLKNANTVGEDIAKVTDMSGWLKQAQAEGTVRKDFSAEEMWRFVSETNLAVLERIGLMDESEYDKKEVKKWIGQLTESYRRYLQISGG